jgi:hypothetical protein
LERLFDRNDVFVKVKGLTENVDVVEWNLEIEEDQKYVKLSSSLSKEKRDEYVKLMEEIVELFLLK